MHGEARHDNRLPSKEVVAGLIVDGIAKAYSFQGLHRQPVLNDKVNDRPVVVAFDIRSETAVAYGRRLGDRTLSFRLLESDKGNGNEVLMVDEETGTQWSAMTGEGLNGPLTGEQLDRIAMNYAFWFAWKDYHPSTQVFSVVETRTPLFPGVRQ